jgi:hypothetical protein
VRRSNVGSITGGPQPQRTGFGQLAARVPGEPPTGPFAAQPAALAPAVQVAVEFPVAVPPAGAEHWEVGPVGAFRELSASLGILSEHKVVVPTPPAGFSTGQFARVEDVPALHLGTRLASQSSDRFSPGRAAGRARLPDRCDACGQSAACYACSHLGTQNAPWPALGRSACSPGWVAAGAR